MTERLEPTDRSLGGGSGEGFHDGFVQRRGDLRANQTWGAENDYIVPIGKPNSYLGLGNSLQWSNRLGGASF